MQKVIKHIVFFILIASAFNNAIAETNNTEIKKLIKNYLLKENIKNSFEISESISLPDCSDDISIKNIFKNYKTLELTCLGKNNWSYNVRTNIKDFSHKKGTNKKKKNKKKYAVITLKNIKKGQILSKEDVALKSVQSLGGSNYYSKIEDVIGKSLRQSLRKDQILRERHMKIEWTITEGQKVIIENNKSNIQILVDGIAAKSAMQGEYLEVINNSSGKKIKAWVINSKKVSIFR